MINYYDRKELSNSALSNLALGVKYYKDALINDDENQYSILGNVIHTYILENDKFHNVYAIEPDNIKLSSSNQKKYCALRASGSSPNDAYSLSYTAAPPAKRMALEEAMTPYIEFLKDSKGKKVISLSMYQSAINIDANIKKHKLASELMNVNTFIGKKEAYNEKEFFFEIDGIQFKSKLDRLIIDYDKKEVTIIDLKTYTMKYKFQDRIKIIKDKFLLRDMDRQLYIYKLAVQSALKKEYGDDFTFKFKILFTATNLFNYVDILNIDENADYFKGKEKLEEGLRNYRNYLKNEESDFDAYYHNGDGSLEM